MNLQSILDRNGLTLSAVGELIGKEKSTVSKIISGNYPNAARLQCEIAEALKSAGYDVPEDDGFEISLDVNAFMPTLSVQKVFALYQSLLAPESTLNSSIGCVTGSAGRGKTYAAKRFCLDNQDAVYVLYVDGFSQTMLIREICEALTGLRHRTFERCLMEIKQASSARRRLVIIDEADKMPVPFLEMLRALNEAAGLPLALVGEDRLHSKMAAIPRLRSRIRNPYISFTEIDPSEVMIYYQTAAGVDVDPSAVNYLWQKAKGDFRTIANDAFAAVEMMKANAMRKLTLEAARSLYE